MFHFSKWHRPVSSRGVRLWGCVTGIVLMLGAIAWATNVDTGTSLRRNLQSVQRYKIDDSTGTVTLVPAVTGKRIQVWGVTLATATATTMEFKSGANSLTGPMTITAIQIDPPVGDAPRDSAIPWLESNAGEAIVLTLGGTVQVCGQVIWTSNPP